MSGVQWHRIPHSNAAGTARPPIGDRRPNHQNNISYFIYLDHIYGGESVSQPPLKNNDFSIISGR